MRGIMRPPCPECAAIGPSPRAARQANKAVGGRRLHRCRRGRSLTRLGKDIMASPIKGRSRARGASIAAILGAATVLVAACETEEGESPPLDFDAEADGTLGSPDGETDSTLVDLDGEADAGHFPHDAAGDHDAGGEHDADAARDHEAGGSGSSGGGSSSGGTSSGSGSSGASGSGGSGGTSSGGTSGSSSGEIS